MRMRTSSRVVSKFKYGFVAALYWSLCIVLMKMLREALVIHSFVDCVPTVSLNQAVKNQDICVSHEINKWGCLKVCKVQYIRLNNV